MSVSAVEQLLQEQLHAHAETPLGPGPGSGPDGPASWMRVMCADSTGVWRTWVVPFPVLIDVGQKAVDTSAGAAGSTSAGTVNASTSAGTVGSTSAGPVNADANATGAAGAGTPAERLRESLVEMGLGPQEVELFASAATAAAALATGADLAQVAAALEVDQAQSSASASATDTDTAFDTGTGTGTGTGTTAGADASATAAAGVEAGAAGECGVGDPDLSVRVAGAAGVLEMVGSLTRLGAHLEGVLVSVVGDLTVRNGRVLLARKGITGPDDLSANQLKRWKARAKSVTRAEIEALTGWGEGEVSDLVALANAPADVREPVVASMGAGVTPWRLARRFFREVGAQAHEDTAEVADRLFGTDPATACTDRLDPDGALKDGPWEHKLFRKALEGEVTRLASRDPAAAARQRALARQRRDVKVVVHEDGTGSLTIHGTAAQVTAAGDRLQRGAREARAGGDGRTQADLRADLALSLLLHSTLALPQPLPADADEMVRTAWTEQMAAVLAALPPAVLNVIVPFDALVHSPQRPLFDTPPRGTAAPPAEPPRGTAAPATGPPPQGTAPPTAKSPPQGTAPPTAGSPQGAPAPPAGSPQGAPAPPAGSPPGRGGGEVLSMGLVTGAFPQFLTPDAVRELALTPGTVLHRLLTDPADGRCVERSIGSYAPDAAMRAQVHAADVTCRAPGCVQHAPYTQLDHVTPYGQGGATSEANLQDLHTRHHDHKTHGGWEAVMAPNRDVTWRSLLGRIYRTRAHDYRQYSTLYRAALDRIQTETEQALADDTAAHAGNDGVGMDGRGEARTRVALTRQVALADAVDRAIYRALTYRGPARPLRDGDDHPDSDTDPAFLGWDAITLTHTTPTGQHRYGPHPAIAEAERSAQQAAAGADSAASGTSQDTTPGSADTGWRHDPNDDPPPF